MREGPSLVSWRHCDSRNESIVPHPLDLQFIVGSEPLVGWRLVARVPEKFEKHCTMLKLFFLKKKTKISFQVSNKLYCYKRYHLRMALNLI
jgi:hypothetical protein